MRFRPLLVAFTALVAGTLLAPPTHADDRSVSIELAHASGEALPHDGMRALLLAREALQRNVDADTRSAAYSALARTYERALLAGHAGRVTSADTSGDFVATGSEDKTARLWRLDGEAIDTVEVGRPVRDVHLLGDGRTVLVVSWGGSGEDGDFAVTLHRWQGEAFDLLAQGIGRDGYHVSPGRDAVFVERAPGTWTLFDAKGGARIALEADAVGFSPTGRRCFARKTGKDVLVLDTTRARRTRLKETADATSVQFDAEGARVLVHGAGRSVGVFDRDGAPAATLAHDSGVERAAFSPKDGSIVVATRDAFVRWSKDGRREATLPKSGPCDHLVFSNDGAFLVTVTNERDLQLWVEGERQASASTRLAEAARRVTIQRSGRWITAHLESGTYAFFDVELKPRHPFGSPAQPVSYSRLDPWDRWDLNASEEGPVVLLSFVSQQPMWLLGHTDAVVDAAFTADGLVVTASRDGTARVWEPHQRGTPTLGGHQAGVYGGAFLWDLDRVVTMAWGDSMLWDLEGRSVGKVHYRDLPVWWAFAPDAFAVAVRRNGLVFVFDGEGDLTRTLDHGAEVHGVAYLDDGSRLLAWSNTGKNVGIWRRDGKRLGELVLDEPITQALFATRDRIAVLAPESQVRVYDVQGREKARWPLPEPASRMSRSGDGTHVWTQAADGSVARLFDATGGAVAVIDDHAAPITSVDLAPKPGLLLSASQDGVVRVRSLEGEVLHEMRLGTEVHSVSFFPGDERYGVACEDGSFRIHRTDGTRWATLHGHRAGVTGFHFSRGGSRVVTLSKDHTARLWPATDDTLRRVLEERAARAFTPDEKEAYEDLLAR